MSQSGDDDDDDQMLALHLSTFLDSTLPFSALRPSKISLRKVRSGEVLVRVTHTSPQQVDLLYARGKHQNNNSKHGYVHPRFTLGLDFAGVVSAIATAPSQSDATANSKTTIAVKLRVGDRVMGSHLGAFAEYLAVPSSSLHPIPARLSSADAAALVGGVVSYCAVRHLAGVRRDERVLVTGVPGGLGIVATRVAAAAGAQVFVLARTEERARSVRKALPFVEVLNADSDWVNHVKMLTGGRGVNVVIDNVGIVEDALRCVAWNGRIVLVGFAGRKGVMERVPMNLVLLKGARLIGFRFGEAIRQGTDSAEESWESYLELLAQGVIRPLVDDRQYRGIESIPYALQDLADSKLQGKAVVHMLDKGHSKL